MAKEPNGTGKKKKKEKEGDRLTTDALKLYSSISLPIASCFDYLLAVSTRLFVSFLMSAPDETTTDLLN